MISQRCLRLADLVLGSPSLANPSVSDSFSRSAVTTLAELVPRLPRSRSVVALLVPQIPVLVPRAPKLALLILVLVPRAPTLVPRAPTLVPRAPKQVLLILILAPRGPILVPRDPMLVPQIPVLVPRVLVPDYVSPFSRLTEGYRTADMSSHET